jgi:AcrR family transcriptional regulator
MSEKPRFFASERRGYHHGSLKDALLEAARTLLTERGAAGFTLAEAAKLVGVTGAAPYRHFSDRTALMSELARRGFDMFGDRLIAAWDEGRPDAGTALRRMGTAYLAFARAEPGLYGAMFDNVGALSAPEAGTAADRALEILRVSARQILRQRGALDAGARQLALEIWSMSHGVATLTLAGHLDAKIEGCDPAAILDNAVTGMVDLAVRRGGGT